MAGMEFVGSGAEMIATERYRQAMVEGWTPEHDDAHTSGELLNAALCYAQRRSDARMFGYEVKSLGPPARWPWGVHRWKPKDEVRDLVRAGALIAAEIDRLKRTKAMLVASELGGPENERES